MTTLTDRILITDIESFGLMLGTATAASKARTVAPSHPTMKKVRKLQIDLALGHMRGEVVEIPEDDLIEIIVFQTACRKASGADLIPRTLPECHELLAEGIITPESESALRPFNQDSQLRPELKEANALMLDELFSRYVDPPMVYPAITAWNYDDVIMEVERNSFDLMHWTAAHRMVTA